jgi:signal transduction histidine kinase
MPGATEPATASIPIEAVHRLAASIVHAVSNSLSIIIGNAQYLLLARELAENDGSRESEEPTSTLEAILNESRRLTGLMGLLLSFSSKLAVEAASSETALAELERLTARLMPSGPRSAPAAQT